MQSPQHIWDTGSPRTGHICSRLWRTPGNIWATTSSEKLEPTPPSRHWPANRNLTFLPSPWGASLVYRMQLLEAVIFISLWACELLPLILIYKRDQRNSFCYRFTCHLFMEICLFLLAVGLGQSKLEQPKISISMARDKSALIPCKVFSSTFGIDYIHWYRQKPGQSIEHLLYVVSTTPVRGKNNKFEASKNPPTSTSILKINFLEKEDEAVYFCACWTDIHSVRGARITCTRTIFSSVPTHILLNMGNHRGCTTRHLAWTSLPTELESCTFYLFLTTEITHNVNDMAQTQRGNHWVPENMLVMIPHLR